MSKSLYHDAMRQASASSALARKHLLSLIDGTEILWMGSAQSDDSKIAVAAINQNNSAHFYAAARQYRAEMSDDGLISYYEVWSADLNSLYDEVPLPSVMFQRCSSLEEARKIVRDNNWQHTTSFWIVDDMGRIIP